MCMCLWLKRFPRAAAALTAAVLLSSCIPVGPDFLHPAAPDVDRYTPEKLPPRTSSTDAPTGQAQRFVQGRDIPQEWWRMFKSRALNALIERSLRNNPTLQSTMSALRVSKEAVYAQQGKFLPLVQSNFTATRQCQHPAAAHRAVDLSASADPSGAGARRPLGRYGSAVPGARRRLVEPDRTAERKNSQRRNLAIVQTSRQEHLLL